MRPITTKTRELDEGVSIARRASEERRRPDSLFGVTVAASQSGERTGGTESADRRENPGSKGAPGKRTKDRGARDLDGSGIPGDVPTGTPIKYARRPIPPKLYRIGELIEYSGMSRQTVHNYTTMGLLTEARRTEGGHRLYDESVFARLDLIIELKSQGRSLREIREYFAKLGSP